jgi:hypothetical protein
VFPLRLGHDGTCVYLSLDEAIATGQIVVTEVSNHGSVPELKVINKAPSPVLIVDGEELIGAKQNRVVNTSILLQERSETVIPVSCTEAGRWAYASMEFSSSDVIMELKTRSHKTASVSDSLRHRAAYASDQAGVWDHIQALHAKAQVQSATAAMHDAFEGRRVELGQALAFFPCLSGQQGILVFLNGKPAGFDLVSRSEVYQRLHPKLVRSYILDALLSRERAEWKPDAAVAGEFLRQAGQATEKRFRSVGYGEALRFSSPALVGAALLHEREIIHAALFQADPPPQPQPESPMQSLRMRMRRMS